MELHEKMAQKLKALSDVNRLKLIACLKQGEVCVCDLVEVLRISQPAVSQQLKKLKEAGIVLERKRGTWKHVRLNEVQEPYIQAVIDRLEPLVPAVRSSDCCADCEGVDIP